MTKEDHKARALALANRLGLLKNYPKPPESAPFGWAPGELEEAREDYALFTLRDQKIIEDLAADFAAVESKCAEELQQGRLHRKKGGTNEEPCRLGGFVITGFNIEDYLMKIETESHARAIERNEAQRALVLKLPADLEARAKFFLEEFGKQIDNPFIDSGDHTLALMNFVIETVKAGAKPA